MDHNAKAKFILALHKHSLQAFDSGGPVLSGPSTSAVNQNASAPSGIAGTVGGILGLNNNFQAGAANIQAGTNTGQLNDAYTGAQGGLQSQQNFANQAAHQGGFGNQSAVFSQQQALANQLQQQANGQGPNPAQAALNQATGQNVANQSALMAGQRGASANPALIARQAAQQGAATQQQAVGQGATLQAQQQIAAQAALANQQAQMQGVAANQIAAQGQGANNYSSAQQNEQNILQGANTSYNNAAVSQQGNINNVNAQTAASNQNMAGTIIGGVGSALSHIPVVGSLFGATGGLVKSGGKDSGSSLVTPSYFADGGFAMPTVTPPALMAPMAGPQSFAGQWLNSQSPMSSGPVMEATSANPEFVPPEKSSKPPGKPNASPSSPASGGMEVTSAPTGAPLEALGASSFQKGGRVKAPAGEKAVKKDNSYDNDKVPAMLSEGEIVIPRSITTHPQAPEKAAAFVQAVLNKKRMGRR